ncbi:hypothetical protein ACFWOJ_33305 [Streptomyces sp. NPDC058439]|uniref:hypothetical protein n=1 Tax=Streptomyces sp. NPDC058439 TaxID=3346500 RepID=UPI0036631399
MSSEYGTGTIRASPDSGAGSLAPLGSLLAGLLLPGNGFSAGSLSLAEGPTLRATAGTVLCIALIALGLAARIRDTAGAITAVLGLFYAFPVVTIMVVDEQWREHLQELAPASAGLAVQATRNLDALPIGPWPGPRRPAARAAALAGKRDGLQTARRET